MSTDISFDIETFEYLRRIHDEIFVGKINKYLVKKNVKFLTSYLHCLSRTSCQGLTQCL